MSAGRTIPVQLNKILLIRLSAIGDIVFATPFLRALRLGHPDAHIAWLVDAGLQDLLQGHPNLDEVIPWPQREWTALWRAGRYGALFGEVRRFARALRARGFDTAIDLQGLLKSGVWAWASGAPTRIGLGSREGSQYLMTRVVAKGGEAQRMSSEYIDLAEVLGLDPGDGAARLAIDTAAAAAARARMADADLVPGRYAVLAPFTTRPQKHWVEAHWRALIPLLRRETGLPVVLLGGPADRLAAARIADGVEVIDWTGQTRLPEAAALIRDAALLIGVDTGLTHMGHAFMRPTVCLFGSTRPYLTTANPHARVIYHALPCSPCKRRPTCNGAFTCLREITPEEVLTEVRAVLGAGAS